MPVTFKLISLVILTAITASAASCRASTLPSTAEQTDHRPGDAGITAPTSNSRNSSSAPGNTLVIRLEPNNPIREIIINEGFVNGGGEPIFEIDGNPGDIGNSTMRIGTLTMDTVDARRLEILDTQVVTANLTNVIAHDDELNLAYTTVTVVFVARGANSTLSHNTFRVDRIRILGISGSFDTHLERLTVTRSSFSGRIRIEDAQIQNLILTNVSLED